MIYPGDVFLREDARGVLEFAIVTQRYPIIQAVLQVMGRVRQLQRMVDRVLHQHELLLMMTQSKCDLVQEYQALVNVFFIARCL
jgi:hypothetical protein